MEESLSQNRQITNSEKSLSWHYTLKTFQRLAEILNDGGYRRKNRRNLLAKTTIANGLNELSLFAGCVPLNAPKAA
jgi:hypothetical protein